jgi:predicted kinase
VLKDRVAARASDASDATPRVVDKQLDADLGAIAWTRMASVEDGWVERALGRLRL